MKRNSLFRRYESFVAAACIAAHANSSEQGFRQRDVRFLLELFINWIDHSLDISTIGINNTQVSRYLDQLAADGYARRTARRTTPAYRLSRIGLIELLSRILPGVRYLQPEQFAFIYYFVKNYRQRLLAVIESEGRQFPLALKLEVEALLDVKTLVVEQLRCTELEIKKLKARMNDSQQSSKLAQKLFARGCSLAEVAREVETLYPYELNSQKPLSQIMTEVPEDLARWDMQFGAQQRVLDLWEPVYQVLVNHEKYLRGRLSEARSGVNQET